MRKDGARRKRALTERETDQILFPVVQMFLMNRTADQIVTEISQRFDVRLTREAVYPLVREAVRRQYLIFVPPRDKYLSDSIEAFAGKSVSVVDTRGPFVGENVAAVGAQTVLDLIRKVADEKRAKKKGGNVPVEVHLGLGIGQATMRAVRQLAAFMRADITFPKIVVHSLSTPHSVHDPLETPLASFALFNEAYEKPGFVDLVTEPVVPCEQYEEVKRRRHVKDAFKQASKIDILLTSMAAANDVHGYLYRYVQDDDGGSKEVLAREGWVGDVQMRPYSRTGPIEITRGNKPVTLFEIAEMVSLARRRHVVLLCSPCGHCQQSKAEALFPLLTRPSLRVWNHLVLDVGTAREVLELQHRALQEAGVGLAPGL